MNTKRIVSRVLIAFVLMSFGYLGFRSVRAAKDWHPPTSVQAATPETKEPPTSSARAR